MAANAVEATLRKFGYPATVIAETSRWSVLLRPQQVTLGAAVLVCREPVEAFGAVSGDGFAALQPVVADIEAMLRDFVAYDKINYLMLMMVDPAVHFHVIPRYASARTFEGIEYPDAGWPGPPRLDSAVAPDAETQARLVTALRQRWPGARL